MKWHPPSPSLLPLRRRRRFASVLRRRFRGGEVRRIDFHAGFAACGGFLDTLRLDSPATCVMHSRRFRIGLRLRLLDFHQKFLDHLAFLPKLFL